MSLNNDDNEMKFPITIFVYGTLKTDYWNNRLLEDGNAAYVKDHTIDNVKLCGSDNSIPYGVRCNEGSKTYGELWTVYDKPTLNSLDRLEGHPDFYCRQDVNNDGIYVYLVDEKSRYLPKNEVKKVNNVYYWGNVK